MTDEKVMTLHPEGKQGVNISAEKYEMIKDQIISHLQQEPLTYSELVKKIESTLVGFDGSISWYTVVVKLDLEAKGIIRRLEEPSPEKIVLS